MDAIANFSEHVVETGYGDLSSAAVAATKTFLLDTIGVAVAGSAGPWVEELVDCLGQCWGTAQHASVWVGGAKIAAIGVRFKRWVTSHGFALNVSPDLSYFDLIVPCGLAGKEITSMERLNGIAPGMADVKRATLRHFLEVFA